MTHTSFRKPISVLLSLLLLLSAFAGMQLTAGAAAAVPYVIFNSGAQTLTFAVGEYTNAGVRRANGQVISGDNYYTDFTTVDWQTGMDHPAPPWYTHRNNVTKVVFLDTIAPISTVRWFYEYRYVTSFEGLDKLDMSNVTRTNYMFATCRALTSVDVSSFNTSNVTTMESMFYYCDALTSLDLSGFDMTNVTKMYDLFGSCKSLTSLTLGEKNKFASNVGLVSAPLTGNYTGKWVKADDETKTYTSAELMRNYDGSTMAGTYVLEIGPKPFAIFDETAKTLTFAVGMVNEDGVTRANGETVSGTDYLSGFHLNTSSGSNSAPWNSYRAQIEKVVFLDEISPLTVSYWFYNCTALQTIEGLELLDTSDANSMEAMFMNCSEITSLDLSALDTSNVTSTFTMFYGCSNLASLDLSSFNMANNTFPVYMFKGCNALSSLTLGENFVFGNNTELCEAPSEEPFTGKWIRDNSEDAPLTAAELMANYDGSTMAGTYVWECTHTFGTPVWSWADGNTAATAAFTCTACGKTKTVTDDALDCAEVTPASCTADQTVKYTASVEFNNETYTAETEAVTVPNTAGHSYIDHDAQTPTCTEVGWDAYQTCANCNYTSYVEIPAAGHSYVDHEAKAPTCNEIGWNAYRTCANCDYTEYAEIPATGNHTTELVNAKEATATEDGYTGDAVCTVCGRIITTGEVIPAVPATPAGGSDVCPYCGETHDASTFSGFFIDFFHDLLFIIQQIIGSFTKW